MRQQINLYQDALIDKQEPLQSRQAGFILAGFMALLVLLGLFGYWQLRSANRNLEAMQQQRTALEKKLAGLEQEYPPRQKSALLEEELRRAKETLAGQKKLLDFFAERDDRGNDAVVAVLEGLARHSSPGVWLRRIRLNGDGSNIALAGSALRPEQVPQYLQSLGAKGVLRGQVFSRLTLARLQERPGQVDFNLESLPEGQ